jgi:hypothetical protein
MSAMWSTICWRRWEKVRKDSARYAADVGDAVADRSPADAEPVGELGPQLSLVEESDRATPRVELTPVEGRPAPVALGAGDVGDHHVGVEVRVTRPGRAVPERGSDESVAGSDVGTTSASSNSTRLVLKDGECGIHRRLVSLSNLPPGLNGSEGEHQRHRLRGVERAVVPGHPLGTLPSEQRRARQVVAGEDGA